MMTARKKSLMRITIMLTKTTMISIRTTIFVTMFSDVEAFCGVS